MHRRYYIPIILGYYNISNTYLGCNISDAHRPTIPFLPRGTPRSPVSPALPSRRALRRPVILPGTPQVVIPHVDPLHLHVGPEGVGDPEKALRLDFKALQPLNPPQERAAEGRTACPGRFCGP